MQTNPLCGKTLSVDPPICLPGWVEGGCRGESLPGCSPLPGGRAGQARCRTHAPPRGGPKGRLAQRGWPSRSSGAGQLPRLKACAGDGQFRLVGGGGGAERPPPTPLPHSCFPPLPATDSWTLPANRADYSSICSNLKIKTDKVKIFREQCQAKGIKLLSDLYLSNGFMPFNNFKRNIMFFNTLF